MLLVAVAAAAHGTRQVSRWYTGSDNEVVDVDDGFTRLTKRNGASAWDHACLPPVQFEIEQHRTAELCWIRMRTYHIEWLKPQPPESVGVQFKLAAMGDIFMTVERSTR